VAAEPIEHRHDVGPGEVGGEARPALDPHERLGALTERLPFGNPAVRERRQVLELDPQERHRGAVHRRQLPSAHRWGFLEARRQAVGLGPVTLMGHSWGGLVAPACRSAPCVTLAWG
jgi:hypothetical protein